MPRRRRPAYAWRIIATATRIIAIAAPHSRSPACASSPAPTYHPRPSPNSISTPNNGRNHHHVSRTSGTNPAGGNRPGVRQLTASTPSPSASSSCSSCIGGGARAAASFFGGRIGETVGLGGGRNHCGRVRRRRLRHLRLHQTHRRPEPGSPPPTANTACEQPPCPANPTRPLFILAQPRTGAASASESAKELR